MRDNKHETRESWLNAGTNEARIIFLALGYTLPDKIRCAIAFTSTGKRGHIPGECWHPPASADGHYEIIIRADLDDPVSVLSVLVHELCHTLLSPAIKHGKAFKQIAERVGFEGRMRPFPHAKLNFGSSSDVPRKQTTRMLKAECHAVGCGYTIRLASKWAQVGLPVCPADTAHGTLVCDMPKDAEAEETEVEAL